MAQAALSGRLITEVTPDMDLDEMPGVLDQMVAQFGLSSTMRFVLDRKAQCALLIVRGHKDDHHFQRRYLATLERWEDDHSADYWKLSAQEAKL